MAIGRNEAEGQITDAFTAAKCIVAAREGAPLLMNWKEGGGAQRIITSAKATENAPIAEPKVTPAARTRRDLVNIVL